MFLHNLVSGNADSTAVNFVDDQLVASCLTYKQLWSLSDDIYAALKCQDLSENSGIGVLLETSIILPSVLIG